MLFCLVFFSPKVALVVRVFEFFSRLLASSSFCCIHVSLLRVAEKPRAPTFDTIVGVDSFSFDVGF